MILFKYIFRRNYAFSISCRLFSSNSSETVPKSTKSEPCPNVKLTTEVHDYMKDNDASHLFEGIPVQFLKKTSSAHKFILINPSIAKRISLALKLYLKDSYVLESEPGFGLLSRELINTVSYLRLYEEDRLLRSYLRELSDKYPNKVEIFDRSLHSIQRLQLEDQLDNRNRMKLFFGDIPTDINVNIIVIAPSKEFISRWIQHILNKDYFSKFSKLDFYFLIPPSVYTRLIASPQNDFYPRYEKISVLSQILFDITLLVNDIPRNAFLPWPKKPATKKQLRNIKNYENDHEVVYFVRMSLKSENLNNFLAENYQCFSSFVGQNMIGKKRIVPYFETIIPGSGPRVIMLGYNIYTTFNELSPSEIFSLFLEFIKWPEFKKTAFYTYWINKSSFDDHDATTNKLQIGHGDDLHDEDDNDDEAFLPGNKIK